MRVLMTADAVGGVWSYMLELARALERRGIRFDVALMGPPPSAAQRAAAQRLGNLTLHESGFRLEWMDDCWADVDAAGEWLLALQRSLAPVLVHLNGYTHAALPWQAPTLVVAHSCVLSWWRATHGVDAPPRYDEYRRRVANGLRAADRVVAPTAAMLLMLQESHGTLRHARVIRNGRVFPAAAPGRKQHAVLGAGRVWDEAKNLGALARAAARLTVPVRIAGPDTDPHGRRIALEGVELLGPLDYSALAAEYARAAIFAAPARYEPFGLAALEAAHARCALVLGDIPTQREVWGDAALYVPPDDDAALAATIQKLLDEPALRAELGRRAHWRALAYAPERMAADYAHVYAEVAAVHVKSRMGV